MIGDAEFIHVVMTRFNLATKGRESGIRNRPGWLSERFDLFERYCLPTLAAQTEQKFHWIIYFDDLTPEPFRERIERCRAVREFTPFFTPLFDAEGWPSSIHQTYGRAARQLLTTRLDNDDGLASDHVARLHTAVLETRDGSSPRSFNFSNGYVMAGSRIYSHRHLNNAFASWLEPFDNKIRTAASIPHMRMDQHGPVIQLQGPGAWLQVVHGGNVSNKIRGRRIERASLRERFPTKTIAQIVDPTPSERAAESLILGPGRVLRDRLISIWRRGRFRGCGSLKL